MTEQRGRSLNKTAPTSPLDPYRTIIQNNTIEDHFTDKRLQKQMRHLGLISNTNNNNNNKDPTSLAHDQYMIDNSQGERHKRFRRKFIVTMVDTIEEIDRARQAQFRDQLDLWDKMYSNCIQRIQAQDRRLERKYGLFIDRQMKKELIRENLSQMPHVPSLKTPQILPHFIPKRAYKRTKRKRASSAPSTHQSSNPSQSRLDILNQRINKLESLFEEENIQQHIIDVNLIKNNYNILINQNQFLEDHLNNIKDDIQHLQTHFNQRSKEQDIIKIIQAEHQQKIDQLTSKLDKEHSDYINKNIFIQLKTLEQTKVDYSNFNQTVNQLQKQLDDHSNDIETRINHHLNKLGDNIDTLEKRITKILPNQTDQIKGEIQTLKSKLIELEKTIDQIKLSKPEKDKSLPYVEKVPPTDLFDIDWSKYH